MFKKLQDQQNCYQEQKIRFRLNSVAKLRISPPNLREVVTCSQGGNDNLCSNDSFETKKQQRWGINYFYSRKLYFPLGHQRFKNKWKQLNNFKFYVFCWNWEESVFKNTFCIFAPGTVESHRLHLLRIAHSLDGLLLLRNMVAIIFLMLAHQRLKNKRKQQNNFKFCYFCWNRK